MHAPTQQHSIDQKDELSFEDLLRPFVDAYKPASEFRVGIEAERFGLFEEDMRPLQYDGPDGIVELFGDLGAGYGWSPKREREGGPIIGLKRGEMAITLEPAGQVELSGAPHADVHAVAAELSEHLAEINAISSPRGLVWLSTGFHPLARHEQLSWVPKARYGIMRQYLAQRGEHALDMMRRTATIQANFDFRDDADAMRKLRVALRLSPIIAAMFANGPFVEGRRFGGKSLRLQVWQHVDPDRQGLLPTLWNPASTLWDYIEQALDVPMFLFMRNDEVVQNTGQTFRSFFDSGFEGHRATLDDWRMHLNTLFPEVRLKSTLEVRGADSVPARFAVALPAIWTGILYDDIALEQCERLTAAWSHDALEALRGVVPTKGLQAPFEGRSLSDVAQKVLRISREGLQRRRRLDATGADESMHLEALGSLIEQGLCPSDAAVEGLGDESVSAAEIVRRTRT